VRETPRPTEALLDASQATTFESQLRDSCPEAEIVAPAEGSEEATVASSNVADEAAERIDQTFEDNYDGIDWLRLPRFTKPLTTSRRKPSWIYQYGYRVVLLTDPRKCSGSANTVTSTSILTLGVVVFSQLLRQHKLRATVASFDLAIAISCLVSPAALSMKALFAAYLRVEY
jgi:hypothetical protein